MRFRRFLSSLPALLNLSLAIAFVIGLMVFGGVKSLETALIWAGVSFIVAIVALATLALAVPESDEDPNQPRLK